jgi:peptidyl-prolyl cis-trans isomerase B (cyclophilin B)
MMKVLFETTKGNITIQLDTEKAPNTCANFVEYVKSGHYDGTIFHRVIKKFMIQGGGMDAQMSEKSTGKPIQNEANNGLKNKVGSIAMARTNDPHSASAQFFINVADNDFLNFKNATPQGYGYAVFGKVVGGMDVADNDFLNFTSPTANGWGYAVFGEVTEGLEIVKEIEAVKTGRAGYHQDVPVDAIVINKASIVE